MRARSYRRDKLYNVAFDATGGVIDYSENNVPVDFVSGNADVRSVDFTSSQDPGLLIARNSFFECGIVGDIVIPDNFSGIRKNAFTRSSGINDIYINMPVENVFGTDGTNYSVNPFFNGPVGKLYISAEYIDGYGEVGDTYPLQGGMEIDLWKEKGDYTPSITKSYVFSTPATVNEGQTLLVNLTTTNVEDGTVLYWGIYGDPNQAGQLTAEDISAVQGSVEINNNQGQISFLINTDDIQENTESFFLGLFSDASYNNVLTYSNYIGILDIYPTYQIVSNPSVDEGSQLQVVFNTTHVDDGTTFYWSLTNPLDFSVSSGSFNIQNNTHTFFVSPLLDFIEESSETFQISISKNSNGSNPVATSSNITINNISEEYEIVCNSSVDEGSSLLVTVNSTNVDDGSIVYWDVTNVNDFDVFEGNFEIQNNTGSFTVTPRADLNTEGVETFVINIRSTSNGSAIKETSPAITINDTSTTPAFEEVILYRVNAGGPLLTAIDSGPDWDSDLGSSASQYNNSSLAGNNAYSVSVSNITTGLISNPAHVPIDIYASQRYDASATVEMEWDFPVANGTYTVNLFFSEVYFSSAGIRFFDVSINDEKVLTELDKIVVGGGKYTPVFYSYSRVITDGSIRILLEHVAGGDNPDINGIEIIRTA